MLTFVVLGLSPYQARGYAPRLGDPSKPQPEKVSTKKTRANLIARVSLAIVKAANV